MPHVQLPNIRLYYEGRGAGAPILGVHGTSDSAALWEWEGAIDALARLGRVIVHDRRGCTRSERPTPYVTTTIHEQADDAAALLEALGATPAIVIGDSYGGAIAAALAVRHPRHVRALALLEPPLLQLSPQGRSLAEALREEVLAAAAQGGEAVAERFLRVVLGDETWRWFPEPLKRMAAQNGPAILAEVRGLQDGIEPAALASIEQPTLLVESAGSPAAFREVIAVLAARLPDARVERIGGGHLIDPAAPAVLSFVREILGGTLAAAPDPAARPGGPPARP